MYEVHPDMKCHSGIFMTVGEVLGKQPKTSRKLIQKALKKPN